MKTIVTATWIAVALLIPLDTLAQSGSGAAVRYDWPDQVFETQGAMNSPRVQAAEQFADLEVLPFLDSLRVGWAYSVQEDVPVADFDLSWHPSGSGVRDGEIVGRVGDGVYLTGIDLRLAVQQEGRTAADIVLRLDSLWLAPGEIYPFETAVEGWSDFFVDVTGDSARALFDQGFELGELTILRVVFAQEPPVVADERVVVARRQPRRGSVWVPNVDVWIGWTVGRDPYRTRPREPRASRPRGDEMGRSEGRTERGGDRSSDRSSERAGSESGDEDRRGRILEGLGGKDDDEEEKDEDRELLGPALAGMAGVAALAYFGGSVGVFAHADAPIGLQAGRAGPGGGALIQVAVNDRVISGGADELMLALATIVAPSPGSMIHPTLGFGFWIEELTDMLEPAFTVQPGVLVRADRLRFQLAYDVRRGGLAGGLLFQFRNP